MSNTTPQAVRLADYLPPPFLIDTIELDLALDPESTRVRSRMRVRRNPACRQHNPPLRLDGQAIELHSITIDGRVIDNESLVFEEEALLLFDPADSMVIEIENSINPASNSALEGLYQSGELLCTQCEAEGFRRITYTIDRPDVLARYSTRLEADRERYPALLANGNLVDTGSSGDRHWALWVDPFPKPSYLFAIVAGRLERLEEQFTTASGREVTLQIYVEPGNLDRCAHAMASLKRAMRWDEEHFGREYDLDLYMIVAVSDFNMGAMENKGLNIFNARFVLARPETATDADYLWIEGVIAHEYFHNWSGNRITCRDWFQLSLKEGFTVFRDQEFSSDQHSRSVKRIQDVRDLRTRQFPEDAGPMAHPVRPDHYIEINNFYTATVYEKGAEIVRMLHTLLGATSVRNGCDLYFDRHDGQAVTIEDFVACMEEAGQRDLGQFKRWYSQSGTPQLTVHESFDEQDGRYTLTLKQQTAATSGQPHKKPLLIPVRMGLIDSTSGKPVALQLDGESEPAGEERVLELHEEEQRFTFLVAGSRPVPSLLRQFSAPVQLDIGLDEERLARLIACDSDPFNRWESLQQLFSRLIIGQLQGEKPEPAAVDLLADALIALIDDEKIDPALRAEALKLPDHAWLVELASPVDPVALEMARERIRYEIGNRLAGCCAALIERHPVEPYSTDPASIGLRALRNQVAATLLATDDQEQQQHWIDWTAERFRQADNMTDQIAALHLLNRHDSIARDNALEQFRDRWQDDPLVLDKWLAIQASSPLPGRNGAIRALMESRWFNLRNPNRVRALIGTFASANPLHFHAIDGSGYELVAETVIRLNSLNPQVAARLSAPLIQWRLYDEPRRQLMLKQLKRIADRKDLARDLIEIIGRGLAASSLSGRAIFV